MKRLIFIPILFILFTSCEKEDPMEQYVGIYKGSQDIDILIAGQKFSERNPNHEITISKGTKNNTLFLRESGTSQATEILLNPTGSFTGNYKQTVDIQGSAVNFDIFIQGRFDNNSITYSEDLTEPQGVLKIVIKSNCFK